MSLYIELGFLIFVLNHANFVRSKNDTTIGCLYRDHLPRLPPDIFSLWGCWGCYDYLNRYLPGQEVSVRQCRRQGYWVPCHNRTTFFDRHDEVAVAAISATLLPGDEERWLQCCEAADDCCERIKGSESSEPISTCHAVWDGWECWLNTINGTTATGSCPSYIYSSVPTCDLWSEKECYGNAEWNVMTDYTTCSHAPRLKFRHYFHVGILGVAIVLSLPAIVIFFIFRRLKSTRVFLHKIFLIAIVTRNTLVIFYKCLVIIDELHDTAEEESHMAANSAWCRALASLETLATNSVFACMALESVYIHRVLARAFKGQPNMTLYLVAAALGCAVCALSWSIAMAAANDYYCWAVDMNGLGLHWINDSLRLTLLMVNLILLIDIVRVLLTRLRNHHTPHAARIKRTAKATLMLAPVFGIQFLFTAVRPQTRDCGAEQAYYLVSYFLEGLQGPLVALLYCYTNREARQVIRYEYDIRFGPLGAASPRPSFVTDTTELPGSKSIT